MRNRSSKHIKEVEKLKVKEEPHLSGAYIRSLVKQLTSSRTKDPMNNPKPLNSGSSGEDGFPQNLQKFSEGFGSSPPQSQPQLQPQSQPKKQVRRRLHTSRPYQERLLNMAEARREIVTALKFHRAAMKQANEQQQQQSQPPHSLQPEQDPYCPLPVEPHDQMKCGSSPRICPSDYNSNPNFSNYLNSYSFAPFSPTFPIPAPCAWTSPVIAPLPICDNLNFALPNQPLGLNLNFHDFNNIDASFYQNNNYPSIYASSSLSSSSSSSATSPSPTFTTCTDAPSISSLPSSGAFHPAMDNEEMAEIRSIGEQHEVEWNDTLNLVTSAWWFKFLKTMEIEQESSGEKRVEDGSHLFDEVMDIPAWWNDGAVGSAGEGCFLQQRLDDFYSDDLLQDTALPW
ncbi:hypothetical protein ACLOJK_025817 [Asimina triloba]